MIEWLAPGLVYSVLKDAWAGLRGRRRRLTPAQILELRQKWKPLFEEEIAKTHAERLRKDVIIRDVKLLDNYPDVDDKTKEISPWFRVGLLDLYHKGIEVGLRWSRIVRDGDGDGWRFSRTTEETKGLRVILVGRIPFENIEAVDWTGDEYYYFPHIYCYFDARRKEPYENLAFCEERQNPGRCPFYLEIAPYDKVRQLSKELGIDTW